MTCTHDGAHARVRGPARAAMNSCRMLGWGPELLGGGCARRADAMRGR
jgi:hypothetical protein